MYYYIPYYTQDSNIIGDSIIIDKILCLHLKIIVLVILDLYGTMNIIWLFLVQFFNSFEMPFVSMEDDNEKISSWFHIFP